MYKEFSYGNDAVHIRNRITKGSTCNTPNIFFKEIFPMRIISKLVFFLISVVNYFMEEF